MKKLPLTILFFLVISWNFSAFAQTPSNRKTFNRIFQKMEYNFDRNFNSSIEQNIVFHEYVFDRQKNIRFAAHIDGFIITEPWFTFALNARKKGIRENLCFSAQAYNLDSLRYFGKFQKGTLIGGCPYHTGITLTPVSKLASRIEYEKDARNRPKTDVSTQNFPIIIDKRFYTQTVTDSGYFVADTVWKSEPCFILKQFSETHIYLTPEDRKRIENMGFSASSEDISIWNNSVIHLERTYFISKKDYALLHYIEHHAQTPLNGTSYTRSITSTFVKKGKYYVLDYVLYFSDRIHLKMAVYARNDLYTLIYIYRPSEQKSMDNAQIRYNAEGLINYDRFCTPVEKPTPVMMETFERTLNDIQSTLQINIP